MAIKVAYISSAAIPSFSANSLHVMKMCQAMMQEGILVTLYAAMGGERSLKNGFDISSFYGVVVDFPIIRFRALTRLHGYDTILRACAAALKEPNDYIYTRSAHAAAICAMFGRKTICEFHDYPYSRNTCLAIGQFLRSPNACECIFISEALKADFSARFPRIGVTVPAIVAPDGVDLERFCDLPTAREARVRIGLEEKPTLGYAGQLYKGRGIEMLLDLSGRLPGVQFLIVGGLPGDVKRLKKECENRRLDNVIMTGHRANSELPIYLAACDILAMPYQRRVAVSGGGDTSKYMSPMKLFEYMASGRVIVSSDLPVLREILNENNCVLCEPTAISEWHRKIVGVLEHPLRYRQITQKALETVRRCTWRNRVERCLTGLLGAR